MTAGVAAPRPGSRPRLPGVSRPRRPRPSRRWVAVGTALAGGPPRRSVRAELPHTALTSGAWRRSDVRIRVQDLGLGNPTIDGPPETFPRHPVPLASTPQGVQPASRDLGAERFQRRHVAGDSMVVEVPLHHPAQPLRPASGSVRDADASASRFTSCSLARSRLFAVFRFTMNLRSGASAHRCG